MNFQEKDLLKWFIELKDVDISRIQSYLSIIQNYDKLQDPAYFKYWETSYNIKLIDIINILGERFIKMGEEMKDKIKDLK